ncbi:hypothetical protein CA51_03910 [Rosistilla oblonga]|nr:hypothetical protein CA51_03910 [Rosistilla oblonga]
MGSDWLASRSPRFRSEALRAWFSFWRHSRQNENQLWGWTLLRPGVTPSALSLGWFTPGFMRPLLRSSERGRLIPVVFAALKPPATFLDPFGIGTGAIWDVGGWDVFHASEPTDLWRAEGPAICLAQVAGLGFMRASISARRANGPTDCPLSLPHRRDQPRGQLARASGVPSGIAVCVGPPSDQAKMFLITLPWTSVRRKSRPA